MSDGEVFVSGDYVDVYVGGTVSLSHWCQFRSAEWDRANASEREAMVRAQLKESEDEQDQCRGGLIPSGYTLTDKPKWNAIPPLF